MLAANDARRSFLTIIVGSEPPEAYDLVDNEARRNLAARDDEHSRLPIGRGRPGSQKILEVDDGEELAAQIRDSPQPRFGAGDPGDLLRDGQHFAHVGTARHESLGAEAEA